MPVQAMLSKKFGGSAQFTVGRVRFSPVRVLAGTGYRSNHLSSVLSTTFGGSAQLTVGRVRFGPVRLVQAPATAHASSGHA